jgi:hypothetical protein
LDLLWKPIGEKVRFVLVADGAERFILMGTDLTLDAHDMILAYSYRFKIEDFFKWWKEHLKVYHLIARSEYGLMVQIPAGLITYLLLAIYCRQQFNEKVSIKRVRQLRTAILNDLFTGCGGTPPDLNRDNVVKDQKILTQAKT